MEICIIGSGASGWIAAHYLSSLEYIKKITIISPSDIPPIGVGESTTYMFFDFIKKYMNFSPEQYWKFIVDIGGAFKYGVSYRGWSDKEYLNVFLDPDYKDMLINTYYLGNKPKNEYSNLYSSPTTRFAYNNNICKYDINKIPDDEIIINSYHFDAKKFIQTMEKLALKNKKINIIKKQIKNCNIINNNIKEVQLDNDEWISADYYINCIGNSALNEKLFDEKYKSYSDYLLTDRAIFYPLPYSEKKSQMHPFTVAKTMSNGWRWITPTLNRIGTGYVFSSNHISDEQAVLEFTNELGDSKIEPFFVDFRPRRVEKQFKDNWCTIGMASGFLEPLDAPGLAMTIVSLYKLNFLLTGQDTIENCNNWYIDTFNHWCSFILHQYKTSKRNDTLFWKDHKEVNFNHYNNMINNLFYNNLSYEDIVKLKYEHEIFYLTTAGKDIQWNVRRNIAPQKYSYARTFETVNHSDFINNINKIYGDKSEE